MSDGLQVSRKKKFLILIILMVAGGTIYNLPYLRFTYYTPLQEALGLMNDNTRFGNISSVYGIANLICYLPGGYIADKFSSKKLLIFSMVSTGLLGFWFSTFPSYNFMILINALWGITTVLTFWSVYIKYVNIMSASDEQGEMYGWLEGGRGVLGIVLSMGLLTLFNILGAQTSSLSLIIKIVSGVCILCGVLVAFFVPELPSELGGDTGKVTVALIIKALKMPTTWILSAVIFTTYIFAAGTSYLTPYLEFAFGLSAVAAGYVATGRSEIVKILSAPAYGKISKKQGRSTGILTISYLALIVFSISLLLIPGKPSFVIPMIIVILAFGFLYGGNRGIYWALVDECRTPKYTVGTIIGVASIIGFIPDAFIYTLFGSIMDNSPGMPGFRIIFCIFIGVAIAGTIVCIIADRMIKKIQSGNPASSTSDSN